MNDTSSPAETRARLLGAAREQVRARGVAGASSRAITAAAGVNLQAITYHFGGKDALVAAALADEVRAWAAPAIDALAATDRDPAAAMLDAVQHLTATFDEMRDRAPLLLESVVHAVRTRSPDVLALWRDLHDGLASRIDALRAAGAAPAWADANAMATLILSVAAGVTVAVAIDRDHTDHRAVATQFATLLLNASVSD
jgi:AcrR family transcriptional regulator